MPLGTHESNLKDVDPLDFVKLRKLSRLTARSHFGEPLSDFARLLSKLVKRPIKSSTLRDVQFIGVRVKQEEIEGGFGAGSPELTPWSTIDNFLTPTQLWCPAFNSLLIRVIIEPKGTISTSRDW